MTPAETVEAFLAARTLPQAGAEVDAGDLWAAFCAWLEDRRIYTEWTRWRFTRTLRELGFERHTYGQSRWGRTAYAGLCLTGPLEAENPDPYRPPFAGHP